MSSLVMTPGANESQWQQGDFRRILYDAAVGHDVTYRFSSEVIAIDAKSRNATLATGETLSGDVIVGADGVFGFVRELVSGGKTQLQANRIMYQ
jgi:salicylate hydroxylase